MVIYSIKFDYKRSTRILSEYNTIILVGKKANLTGRLYRDLGYCDLFISR